MIKFFNLIILVLLISCGKSNHKTSDKSVKNKVSPIIEKENLEIRHDTVFAESNSNKIKPSPHGHKYPKCDSLNIEVLDSLLPLINKPDFKYTWDTINVLRKNGINIKRENLNFLLTDKQIRQTSEYNASYFLVGKMHQVKNHFAVVLIIETHIFFQVECIIYNFDGDRCNSFTLALVGGDYEGSRFSSGMLIDSVNYKMTTISTTVVNDSIERVDTSYQSYFIDDYCNHN